MRAEMKTNRRNRPIAIKRRLAIRLAATAVVGALAALAVLWAAGGSSKTGPAPRLALAAGILQINDDKDGSAVLSVGSLLPGQSASGDVTITNSGDLAGDYTLAESNFASPAGPRGGVLADQLTLTIEEDGTQIYSGPVQGLATTALGNWAGGESHKFHFTVSLPLSAGDSYQGADTSVDFNWDATAPEPVTTTTSGGGGGTSTTTVVPSGGGGTDTAPPKLTLAGSNTQSIGHGTLSFTSSCDQACTILGTGTISLPGAAKVHKLKPVRVTLTKAGKTKIVFKIDKKTLKLIKKALAKHQNLTAKVKITATSKSGHSISASRTLKLKK
jgi:spore coat-associated protein N